MEISCLTLLDFFKFDRMRKGFEIHFFDISIGLIREIGFFFCNEGSGTTVEPQKS